jgi:hypothetical protein
VRRNIADGCAEFREGTPYGCAVGNIGADENVEVFRRARLCMDRNRITADDEILRALKRSGVKVCPRSPDSRGSVPFSL